jgi:hypothetical protein
MLGTRRDPHIPMSVTYRHGHGGMLTIGHAPPATKPISGSHDGLTTGCGQSLLGTLASLDPQPLLDGDALLGLGALRLTQQDG